jgi:hypothetical protein
MKKDQPEAEKLDEGQVHTRFIIEMLGAPKEHIEKTLRDYVKKLGEDNEIDIIKTSYSNAKPQDKFFSIFVELEAWMQDISKVIAFCFDSLPSSVEILNPQEFMLKSADFSGLLNDLQAKIHDYDFKLKDLNAKNRLLAKNSSSIMKNFIFFSLKEGMKTIDQLSGEIGIVSEHLKPFLDIKKKKKEITLVDNKYKSNIKE